MRSAAIILSSALILSTACDDGDLGVLLPQVAVDACLAGGVEVGGQNMGGTADCTVSFGAVGFNVPQRLEVQISNTSNVSLRVDEIAFGGDADPAFFIETFPTEVPASTSLPLVVWFRPIVADEVRASVVIRTDGSNAPADGITLDLVGSGTEGAGILDVSPLACDFGLKSPGSRSRCEIQLSVRTASVGILSAEVSGTAFALSSAVPGQIPAASSATIEVEFQPAAFLEYAGNLVISTTDPANPTITIPLTGEGTNGPACDIEIAQVNGGIVAGEPSLEPLDDVQLRVTSSHPDAITIWTFLEQPPGSTLGFTDPVSNETRLVFNGTTIGIDVAGLYRVQAVQTDTASGTIGSCELTLTAVPDDELLVQVSWDTPVGDLDLHVIQQDNAGRFCSRVVTPGANTESCGNAVNNDCYYNNCRPFSEVRPDWDQDGVQDSGGDPSLDVDDLCGFGPENINVDFPRGGRYLVGVHHFGFTGCDGAGPATATVRVYSYGQLISEHVKELQPNEFWETAIVDWPEAAGPVCIEDLSTPIAECP